MVLGWIYMKNQLHKIDKENIKLEAQTLSLVKLLETNSTIVWRVAGSNHFTKQ